MLFQDVLNAIMIGIGCTENEKDVFENSMNMYGGD
jgi:hypothetical protein